MAQINRPILTSLAIVILAAQLATIYGLVLGMIGSSPNISVYGLRGVDRDGRAARVLNSVVSRTCTETSTERYLNILAIDPALQGDWLAPEPANYVAVRNLAPHDDLPPCYYDYLGGNFFGSSATDAWNDMLSRGVRYFITIDPEVYPVSPKVYNQALSQHNFPIIWEKVQTSGLFEPEPPLAEDPGILIFRRIDYVALGRTLSNQGEHEQAIDTLKKATALEPANVEAWANLCLAYMRQGGQPEQAISACRRALTLNPDHYWVNSMLAQLLYGQEQWAAVIPLAQRAVATAPDDQQRVASLTLLARAYYRLGDTTEACSLLRQAYAIQQSQGILDVIETLACPDEP